MNAEKITIDALLGEAVGDAFGVPVEFLSRQEVRRRGELLRRRGIPSACRWG